MAIITTKLRVRRWTRSDFTGFQALERVTKIFGVQVWCKEMDREDVPSWAYIQVACLGSTDWRSRLLAKYEHLLEA